MGFPLPSRRALRIVAPIAALSVAVVALSLRVTRADGDRYVVTCAVPNGFTEVGSGADCGPTNVSIGPGSFRVRTDFSGCDRASVRLASTSSSGEAQPFSLLVGDTGGAAFGLLSARSAVSGADLTLTGRRDLILHGFTGYGPDAHQSDCSMAVTIVRTGNGTPAAGPPHPVSMTCSTADVPGAGAPVPGPNGGPWTSPAISCAERVALPPGDYRTDATLTDCGAGVRWLLTDPGAVEEQPAVDVGADAATTTAPDGITPEHTTRVLAAFTTVQPHRLALTRDPQPDGRAYDNATCAIRLTITPAVGPPPPTPSAAAAVHGTPPADEGPFSWQLPAPAAVEHIALHQGTWRLDAGMTPSACGWDVVIPGIAGSHLAHAALPGVVGMDGSSNQVYIPQSGEYQVKVTSSCTVPVALTWLARVPIRTGAALAAPG